MLLLSVLSYALAPKSMSETSSLNQGGCTPALKEGSVYTTPPLHESPRLFVGGLYGDKVVEKWELEQVFAPYGDVRDVWVAKDPPGYAFVEMETVESAREAMAALNNTEALGVTIR